MQTVKPYYLSELCDDDCWVLFAKHVFGYANSNVHQNLRKIGKQIIKKCKGLPLAVKTLAGLLRSKDDTREWYKVLNSEIWDLQDDKSNILPALRLSYHYLPLRRHKRIEEAGDETFSELVSRSFFQQSKCNKLCFVMHHFVNDLAQFVSGKFSVRIEGNYEEVEESARYLLHLIAYKFPAVHWKV